MGNFSLQYPLWFIAFCLLAGAVYAAFMYYKETKFDEGPTWLKKGLMALRFLSVSSIAFLLLSPVIKKTQEDIKAPLIVIAEDRSASIPLGTDRKALASVDAALDDIEQEFKGKYEVVRLGFGGEVAPITSDTFNAPVSNLSNVLQYINDGYVDQNIGAIIMTSDGIYNEGKNPVYQDLQLKVPVYTVALGDTTIRKDLSIKSVLYNKVSYLGDQSSVQIDLTGRNANGAASKVSIYRVDGDQRTSLGQQAISFSGIEDFKTVTFNVDALRPGIIRYEAIVSPINGEISTINNTRTFYVEVLDGRQKILILADGPHPDVAALQRSITTNKNYEVTTAMAADGPSKAADFDLVIFHNLPSKTNDIGTVIDIINRKGTPRLFIAGTQVSPPSFNALQDAIKIEGNSTANEDVQANLRGDFSLFTLSPEVQASLNKYPPLLAKFGTFKPGTGGQVLMDQKIKKIPTKYPLISFSDRSGLKSGVIAGEGLWRWRMFDYQEKQNYESFNELINKTIQYLTVKEDKRKFRVNVGKNVYKENESIFFDAQLFNNSYEMINEPDIQITIRDESKKEYGYTFSKTNNYYTLNAGQFPEGSYTFKASTNYNGQNLTAEGSFRVESVQLEQYNLTADHAVLKTLSAKYNGATYLPNQLAQLKEALAKNENIKPVVFLSTQTKPFMHNKWWFFLILSLLGLEWFLRRYYGSY